VPKIQAGRRQKQKEVIVVARAKDSSGKIQDAPQPEESVTGILNGIIIVCSG
jgi:hypothetical protein